MKIMNFPFEVTTLSPIETESVGLELAKAILEQKLPKFVAMYGDLGVGKTAFVRGFCSVLCPQSTVKSPTFALVNEYRCSPDVKDLKKVCHFDMYRIDSEDDLESIGFYDYTDCIIIAEWSEKIPFALPDTYYTVSFEKVSETDRLITIEKLSDQ